MNGLILFALAVLLAPFLAGLLAFTPLQEAWRYRLTWLLSAGLAIFLVWLAGSRGWLALMLPDAGWVEGLIFLLGLAIASGLGAFLSCLLITNSKEKLWEDNAPPPPEIEAEVFAMHRRLIGDPPGESIGKRAFDLLLSFGGLVISAPVWLVSLFLVWIEDPGPLLFVKNSVGKGGVNFHQFKIRSMVRSAEEETGPVLSQESDERVLWTGRFLRKTALDELPQLYNILRGDMSFVGPRPQRTVLVYRYLQDMPEYARRHCVRPGLAGLAQVAGDYYLTPRQKLRFDRLYIRHSGLGFDLKLLGLAFLIAFWYRWKKDWNGRLPRRLLHRH